MELLKKEKVDIILSNIPYGLETDYSNLYEIPSNSGDSIFMQNIIWGLKEGGTAGVIVPEGLLYRIEHRKFREYLLNKCDVQAIISLPSGVFSPYTDVKTSIIIFKKGSRTKKVWYYDIKNDGFELNKKRKKLFGKNDLDVLREVWEEKEDNKKDYFYTEFNKIKENDFKLSIKFYQKTKFTPKDELKKIEEIKKIGEEIRNNSKNLKIEEDLFNLEKYPKKKIGEICKLLSGFAFKSKYFNSSKQGRPLIRIRDLSKGNPETYYDSNYEEKYLTKKNDLLIGMDGEFNIVIWKSEGDLLNQRIARIRNINEDFYLEYIFYILKKKLKEIEERTPYSTVKHISIGQISNIEIPLAPKNLQKKISQNISSIEKIKELIKTLDLE